MHSTQLIPLVLATAVSARYLRDNDIYERDLEGFEHDESHLFARDADPEPFYSGKGRGLGASHPTCGPNSLSGLPCKGPGGFSGLRRRSEYEGIYARNAEAKAEPVDIDLNDVDTLHIRDAEADDDGEAFPGLIERSFEDDDGLYARAAEPPWDDDLNKFSARDIDLDDFDALHIRDAEADEDNEAFPGLIERDIDEHEALLARDAAPVDAGMGGMGSMGGMGATGLNGMSSQGSMNAMRTSSGGLGANGMAMMQQAQRGKLSAQPQVQAQQQGGQNAQQRQGQEKQRQQQQKQQQQQLQNQQLQKANGDRAKTQQRQQQQQQGGQKSQGQQAMSKQQSYGSGPSSAAAGAGAGAGAAGAGQTVSKRHVQGRRLVGRDAEPEPEPSYIEDLFDHWLQPRSADPEIDADMDDMWGW